MKIIGDRSKPFDRGYFEIVVLSEQSEHTIIAAEAIKELNFNSASGQLQYCTGTIVAPELSGRLVEEWVDTPMQIFSFSPNHNSFLQMTGRFDRINFNHNIGDVPGTFRFQSRSMLSALVDNRCKLEHNGNLSELIFSISQVQNIAATCTFSEKKINVWIDSESTYGALRIIGANFDILIESRRDGTLRAIDRNLSIQEMEQRKPIKIGDNDIKEINLSKGTPVRE